MNSVYIFFHILIPCIFYNIVLPGNLIIDLLELMIACLNYVFREGLEVSFDAGWQKRGSGRSYNSLSGKVFILSQKLEIRCIMFLTYLYECFNI